MAKPDKLLIYQVEYSDQSWDNGRFFDVTVGFYGSRDLAEKKIKELKKQAAFKKIHFNVNGVCLYFIFLNSHQQHSLSLFERLNEILSNPLVTIKNF